MTSEMTEEYDDFHKNCSDIHRCCNQNVFGETIWWIEKSIGGEPSTHRWRVTNVLTENFEPEPENKSCEDCTITNKISKLPFDRCSTKRFLSTKTKLKQKL